MVKVISTSNAALSWHLHWDLQAEGWGTRVTGQFQLQIPENCLNSISMRFKCGEEAWHFCDALHLSLQSCSTRGGMCSPFIDPSTQDMKYSTLPKSSVKLDTRLRLWVSASTLQGGCEHKQSWWAILYAKQATFCHSYARILWIYGCQGPFFPPLLWR